MKQFCTRCALTMYMCSLVKLDLKIRVLRGEDACQEREAGEEPARREEAEAAEAEPGRGQKAEEEEF